VAESRRHRPPWPRPSLRSDSNGRALASGWMERVGPVFRTPSISGHALRGLSVTQTMEERRTPRPRCPSTAECQIVIVELNGRPDRARSVLADGHRAAAVEVDADLAWVRGSPPTCGLCSSASRVRTLALSLRGGSRPRPSSLRAPSLSAALCRRQGVAHPTPVARGRRCIPSSIKCLGARQDLAQRHRPLPHVRRSTSDERNRKKWKCATPPATHADGPINAEPETLFGGRLDIIDVTNNLAVPLGARLRTGARASGSGSPAPD